MQINNYKKTKFIRAFYILPYFLIFLLFLLSGSFYNQVSLAAGIEDKSGLEGELKELEEKVDVIEKFEGKEEKIEIGILHNEDAEKEIRVKGDEYKLGLKVENDEFVALYELAGESKISLDGDFWRVDGNLASEGESSEIKIDPINEAGIERLGEKKSLDTSDVYLKIKPVSRRQNNYLELVNNSNKYRGDFRLKPGERDDIVVVNVLKLEEYLKGVVPAEAISSWDMEALKAQAVASRTYALFYMNVNKDSYEDFDLTGDTLSQVYSGYNIETDRTTEAVEKTRGEVLTKKGMLINALYHSNAGGYTEDPKNVWGSEIDYLNPRESTWDDAALESEANKNAFEWEYKISYEELSDKLDDHYEIGKLRDIEILERTERGRVLKVKYTGEDEEKIVFGDNNRAPLNLRSTNYEINIESARNLSFDDSRQKEEFFLASKDGKKASQRSKDVYILAENGEKSLESGQRELYLESANEIIKKDFDDSTEKAREGKVHFIGKGFGHGVGMSQWGAQGKALEGYGHKEILKYYYSGDIKIEELY